MDALGAPRDRQAARQDAVGVAAAPDRRHHRLPDRPQALRARRPACARRVRCSRRWSGWSRARVRSTSRGPAPRRWGRAGAPRARPSAARPPARRSRRPPSSSVSCTSRPSSSRAVNVIALAWNGRSTSGRNCRSAAGSNGTRVPARQRRAAPRRPAPVARCGDAVDVARHRVFSGQPEDHGDVGPVPASRLRQRSEERPRAIRATRAQVAAAIRAVRGTAAWRATVPSCGTNSGRRRS